MCKGHSVFTKSLVRTLQGSSFLLQLLLIIGLLGPTLTMYAVACMQAHDNFTKNAPDTHAPLTKACTGTQGVWMYCLDALRYAVTHNPLLPFARDPS